MQYAAARMPTIRERHGPELADLQTGDRLRLEGYSVLPVTRSLCLVLANGNALEFSPVRRMSKVAEVGECPGGLL